MTYAATEHRISVARQPWAPSTAAVLQIVLLAGVFLLCFFSETDPDLFWHLGTGRYIVEGGGLPRTDPFSYTAMGTQWIIPEWLGEVTIYLLYAAGGYVTTLAVFAAAAVLTFWLVLLTCRRLGLGSTASSIITVWAASLSWPFWMVRPHIVSFLFFAMYLYLLVRSRDRLDRWIWLLPPAMAIWVNFHSGYAMGFMILGLFLMGEYLNRAWQARASGVYASVVAPLWFLLRAYLPVVLGTFIGASLNPEGPGMLIYPITYVGGRSFNLNFITEWSSPNFHEPYLLLFAASLIFLIVISTRRKPDWAVALPMIAVTFMSLEWVRTIAFYAVVFAPYLATRLADSSTPSAVRPTARATHLNWLVLAVSLAVMASTLVLTDRPQLASEPKLGSFPVAGVQYIKQAHLDGHLFNTYHWGGFVLWSFYPERRVFIDGRTDMYGGKIFKDYREVANVGPNWREVLDRYGVEVMLIEKDSALLTLLYASGEWQEVFRGEVESVLVRKPGSKR